MAAQDGSKGRALHLEALEPRILLSGLGKEAYIAPDSPDDPEALEALWQELLLIAEAPAASLPGDTAAFGALSLTASAGQTEEEPAWPCAQEPVLSADGFSWSGWHAAAGGSSASHLAFFTYTFGGTPLVSGRPDVAEVTLEGQSTWFSPGDPVLPVRASYILLPQENVISSVEVAYGGATVLGTDLRLAAAPEPAPIGVSVERPDESFRTVSTSFPNGPDVLYSSHALCGYSIGVVQVFPVHYDVESGTLTYYTLASVRVRTKPAEGEDNLAVRDNAADRARVAEIVENDEALAGYVSGPVGEAPLLPPGGPYEYVIITSSSLESEFEPLVDQKAARGLTAGIVTTDYIYANYTGTESGDDADKVREFITDAYANWGTQWVLLGGDTDVVAMRAVYVDCGAYTTSDLPSDNYFAAANLVNKTVLYETSDHPNQYWAVWLGEQLNDDPLTYGSYSKIPIRDDSIPAGWTVTEHYDSAGGWSDSDLIGDLNSSPHIVNHLGHANETYNARIYNSDVDALTNSFPYFMYSQGCYSAAFDYSDCIAEHHVITEHGAFGVVMNTRYGWYVPGGTPGASHHWDYEFWDAVFNEQLFSAGQANEDSKVDNVWRVGTSGTPRWIHFELILMGDPETPLEVSSATEPDLMGTFLGVAPKNLEVASGEAVVDFTVRNQAGVDAGAFDVQFYLSDDAAIDPATDLLLVLDATDPNYAPGEPEAYHVSGLAGLSQHFGSVSLTVPVSDPFGTDNDYYVGMFVDADEDVTESNETNNANRGDGLDGDDVFYVTPASYPFLEDWESGTFAGYWRASEGDQGRIQITSANGPYAGTYHVTLDDTTDDGTSSLNELTLCIDLEGQTGIQLRFANREWSDEDDAQDIVQISVDGGAAWHDVVSLTGANSTGTYAERIFELDALGLTYTADTLIRFRQYGACPIPSDGMAFDEIAMEPDVCGPAVVGHTPSAAVESGVTTIRFFFDEPMDLSSFSVAEDVVSFTGPSGDLMSEITGSSWIDSGTLEVQFNPQAESGTYRMTIGPNIADNTANSNPMDQDGDGVSGETPDDRYAAAFAVKQILLSANMDTDPGWTAEGDWEWGVPTGGGSGNGDPTSGYTGTNVYGYNLSGDYANSLSATYLTTSAIDCSGVAGVRLEFYRWLAVEEAMWDHAAIEVSNDGATWTTVWEHTGDTISEWSWSYQTYDISAVADDQSTVYVRWSMGPTDSSVTYPGWNIDDVVVCAVGAGPSVSTHSPSGVVNTPQLAVQLTFDTPMEAGSFAVADDVVSFTGPPGDLMGQITGSSWLDDHTLEITFAEQAAGGEYEMVIGPQILDSSGNPMDQDGDGINGEILQDRYTAAFEIKQACYAANMDTDPGWTAEGDWEWGVPTGGGSGNGDPTSGYTGTNVYGYNLSGDYTNGLSATYATTPAIDCSGYTDVTLEFYRWLGVESAAWDHAAVEVSNDGSTWTTVWEHAGDTISESSWSHQSYDISAVADDQSTVYVRWSMGPTDAIIAYPGWNIDDVVLFGQDADGPAVSAHTPVGTVIGSQSAIEFSFDEPIQAASFAVADDVVSFTGPSGDLMGQITGSSWLDNSTLRITFGEQSAVGAYEMVIGPQILDTSGNPMDQDADGVNGETLDDRYSASFEVVVAGEIHGSKWNDLDGDGIRDGGEPGLEGWIIYLDQNQNAQLDPEETSIATDANGDYSFLDLLPNTYTVAEVLQSGWAQTYPAGDGTHSVPLESGQVVEDVDLGNWATQGEIHGSKWHDLDGDGVWDGEESGLEGWTIYLDQNQNDQLDAGETSTTTDVDGSYSFTSLPAGTYVVAEVLQTDWEQTYPGVATHTVALSATQVVQDVDFGNRQIPGQISGSEWYDADQDGVRDGGEPGLAGWIIYLDQNQNDQRDAGETWTATDSNGDYSFAELPPGTYTVAEEVQFDWTQTYPSHPAIEYAIVFDGADDDHFQTALANLGLPYEVHDPGPSFGAAVAAADPTTDLVIINSSAAESDFSNLVGFVGAGGRAILGLASLNLHPSLAAAFDATVAASITSPLPVFDWGSSSLFAGLTSPMSFTESGFYDDGDQLEPTAGGTAVAGFVSAPATNQAAIIIGNDGATIVNGFVMDDAVTGAEAVQMATNEIELLGGAGGVAGPHTVALSPGQTVTDIDFGNWAATGEIHGSKWEDADGDGTWDAGESGLAAWTIYLDRNQNGQLDPQEPSTTTDVDGGYVFADLVPGAYVVAEELQPQWLQTYPAGDGTQSVGVDPGQTVPGVDFGNAPGQPGPDLAPAQFTVGSCGVLGVVSTSVTFGLHNGAGEHAGAFDVEFFWSDDADFANGEEIAANLDAGDPNYDPANPNAYHVTGGLSAGGNLADTVAISVPRVDPFGTDGIYYLGMRVDESDAVSESDEANNHSQGLGLDMARVNWTRVVYRADFEDSGGEYEDEGFTYVDDPGAPGTNLWHATSHRGTGAHSGPYCQYYGLEDLWHYDTGLRNAGYVVSPPISLSGVGTPVVLSFSYFLVTEGAAPTRDAAVVEVSDDGGVTWSAVADNASGGGLADPTSDWTTWEACISAYAGSEIVVRLNFDTGDSVDNYFEGWYVDDVEIMSSVPTLVFQEPTVGLELIGVPAVLTATEDEIFSYDFDTPIETDGGSVSYLLLDAPVWLGMANPGAGVICGVPTNARVGEWEVTLRTARPGGTYLDHTFTLRVLNAAPTITSEPAPTAVEGVPYTYQVTSDDDPTATYDLLDGPPELSIDPARGLMSGTFDGSAAGEHVVRVQVDDGHGGTDVQAFTLTVLGTDPSFVRPPAELAATEDEAFAYDFDTDDEADESVTYALIGAPRWLTVRDESAGTVAGIPRDTDVGEFEVTIRAEDGYGGRAEHTFTLSVTNVPPRLLNPPTELTAVQRRPFRFDFQTDDELWGGGVRYELAEGPSWLRMANRSRGILLGVPRVAAGECAVTVVAQDSHGAAAAHTFCLTVRQVETWGPPRPTSPVPDAASAGRSFAGGQGRTGALEPDAWTVLQPGTTVDALFGGENEVGGRSLWWLDGLPVGMQAVRERLGGIRPRSGSLASVSVAPMTAASSPGLWR